MKYRYEGSVSIAEIDGKETTLTPGQEYEIKENSRYVQVLIAKKLLLPVQVIVPEKPDNVVTAKEKK